MTLKGHYGMPIVRHVAKR